MTNSVLDLKAVEALLPGIRSTPQGRVISALLALLRETRAALQENWEWGHCQRDAFYGGSKAFELTRTVLAKATEGQP